MFAEFLEDQLKLIPDHLSETEDDTTACERGSVYSHIIFIDFEGHEDFIGEPKQVNIRPKIKSFVQN